MNEAWYRSIEGRIVKIETRSAVDEVHRTNVETRLGEIEDTLKWLVRLVMGALVLSILAYAVRGGLSLG